MAVTSHTHKKKHAASTNGSASISSGAVWAPITFTTRTVHTLPGSLTIATFNVLAPIWKPHSTDWDMESSHHDQWVARIGDVIRIILDMDADIVNLQEYWFHTEFRDMFEGKSSAVAARYHIRAFQRTGRKPDGVAILVRRAEKAPPNRWRYTIVDQVNTPFNDAGQRVALMLRIEAAPPLNECPLANVASVSQFLLSNTHLTFPHHAYDYEMRKRQMASTLDAIASYRHKNKLNSMHAFVCGDFNANGVEEKDNVCRLLGSQGWISSFTAVHGTSPGVTHLTHRNEQFAVDFICQLHEPPLPPTTATATATATTTGNVAAPASSYIHYRATAAVVLPETVSHETWPASFTASDHRPVLVTFSPFVYTEPTTAAAAAGTTTTASVAPMTAVMTTPTATTIAPSTSMVMEKKATPRSAAIVVGDDKE